MAEDTQDFKSLQDEVQAALVTTVKTAGHIASEDLGFHRSLNPEVGSALDEQNARLLALANQLLKSAASVSGIQVPILEDVDDVDNNWRGVVDVVDSLLEKTDTCLDEYTGIIKRKQVEETSATMKSQKRPLDNSLRTQNLVKPQLAFEVKPDNENTSPWLPLLKTKPHAKVSLEDSLGMITNEYDQKQYDYFNFIPLALLPDSPREGKKLEDLSKSARASRSKAKREKLRRHQEMGSTIRFTNKQFRYKHPYETEILQLQYPSAMYEKAEPIKYLPVESTSAKFVDTYEGVLEMLEELKGATEIAVDLEHHDTRSYVGLVSLMQISTREKDWIVDTLKPWRQQLQVLNEVFADPNIIKVFHGAYMDIVWLQRDLGLYVVGLFDTHYACRRLGFAGGSLAFLLKKYIDFDADKKYQLADWRIRPLPEEMFFYARADTHFLLYIFDNLRNELLDAPDVETPDAEEPVVTSMDIVLQKSKETSLLRYERQLYNAESGKGPGGWFSLIYKTPALLSSEQFSVFKAVHAWRDQIARKDDDSINFVMSNSVVVNLAKFMPMDMIALLSIIRPISHSVKSRTGELLEVIKAAKENGKDGPKSIDVLRKSPDSAATPKSNTGAKSTSQKLSKLDVTPVDKTELTTETSSFWGGAFGSSIWEPSTTTPDQDSMRLAIPLPQLSEEVFAETSTPLTDRSRMVMPEAQTPVATPTPSKVKDEPFVLKRGSKRKSETITDPDEDQKATGDYDISLDYTSSAEAERRRAKFAKMEEKRLRKQQKKEAAQELKAAAQERKAEEEESDNQEGEEDVEKSEAEQADEEQGQEDEEEDFDYSKADSVLNSKKDKKDKGGKGGKGKKEKKPFDPYQKSSNAEKGMRRVQNGERGGRSATFKK
ncbi:putative exosome complex exonuclease rrp protein [Botrytis fragariae]|uniref:Putative exosome complex exonuclease rrp protein n=1 Tax=Botrytis fragariae TaxID=1964551 RepID=A0A8H6AZX3_9HELO|nr:putative exosome complex exonuclease rrp protein [Botrytis fragariae]KAF5876649.1 putative exosome complex exonuclease rrp protein [Botrytis fragariae]